jgi:3D (Asp-Asp-Asp) domain-containing protein
MGFLVKALFIGTLTLTSYRSVPEQTDSSPWITSNGQRVNENGVAVSQDMHKRFGGFLDYGDVIYIEGIGFKVVNDLMNPRHKKCIDIWVKSIKEEKIIGVQRVKVWIIVPKYK